MQQREWSADGLRIVVLVLEDGDEAIGSLTAVARSHGLDSAHFTAIGAFQHATVGWFDLALRDYERIDVREQVEVVSLVGDITLAKPHGSDIKVHAHVALGQRDGRMIGGHLLEGWVRPTLELVITETTGVLRRRHDDATGLALIDLGATGGDDAPATRGGHDGQDRI